MARNDKAELKAKSVMHIDPEPGSVPQPELYAPVQTKMPRGLRHTETIVTHVFPGLLPFGMTTMRVRGNRWTIKCGQLRMTGWDGEVDDIVKAFVAKVHGETAVIASEVQSSEFTTEPKSY